MHNWNCEGGNDGTCTTEEVRVLPLNIDAHGVVQSNLIVCRRHHAKEIAWRESENRRGVANPWQLPTWDSLKVYEGA